VRNSDNQYSILLKYSRLVLDVLLLRISSQLAAKNVKTSEVLRNKFLACKNASGKRRSCFF